MTAAPGAMARGWMVYAEDVVPCDCCAHQMALLELAFFAGGATALGEVCAAEPAEVGATAHALAAEILDATDRALEEVCRRAPGR